MTQVGNPSEIFNLPNSMQVAHFVGVDNVLEGVVTSKEQGLINVSVDDHLIEGISDIDPGAQVSACIRPEEVTLALTRSSTSARNSFNGTIISMSSTGPLVRVVVDCGFPLVALITTRSAQQLDLKRGTEVCASFKATGVHIIQG
jgi:molybdopterin-binding protein